MNIDYMYLHEAEKNCIKQEIINLAKMVKPCFDILTDETKQACHNYVQDLKNKLQKLEDGEKQFLLCISFLSDERYRIVITERFYNNKTWDAISEIMNISKQYIQGEIFPKARQEFEKLLQRIND